MNKFELFRKITTVFVFISFMFSLIAPFPLVYGQSSILSLPLVGSMVTTTPKYNPLIIKGMKIFPDNPLKFDFIVDVGDNLLEGKELGSEIQQLIKYFMVSLTIPEEEMWVNLSPYEKNRIIPEQFGRTEMGRDLLSQDYMLKQLTASLMYPEDDLGGEFWDRVHSMAQNKYGTTEVPVNTFNKVWIIPDKADVYVDGQNIFVVKSHLKVLLEEDYFALENDEKHINKGLNGNVKYFL